MKVLISIAYRLGVDLVKIKEGLTEETTITQQDDNNINERETENAQEFSKTITKETPCLEIDVSSLSLR